MIDKEQPIGELSVGDKFTYRGYDIPEYEPRIITVIGDSYVGAYKESNDSYSLWPKHLKVRQEQPNV